MDEQILDIVAITYSVDIFYLEVNVLEKKEISKGEVKIKGKVLETKVKNVLGTLQSKIDVILDVLLTDVNVKGIT